MKIKLAILDKDEIYLSRFVSVFGTKYSDKFQMYSFTDKDVALETLESAKIEVLVASDSFEIDTAQLPKRCSFAYFVDTNGVETINEQYAICKYQKATLICKQILSIYSENAGSIIGSMPSKRFSRCLKQSLMKNILGRSRTSLNRRGKSSINGTIQKITNNNLMSNRP